MTHLTQLGILYERVTIPGATGVSSFVYTKVADNIPCWAAHVKHVFGEFAGMVASQATHILFLDADAPVVDNSMRFEVEGTVYAIEHVDPKFGMSGERDHTECLIYAVENPQSSR